MKKISTLFKKNPENLGLVINEINPKNQWVFDGFGIATRKYDGSACAVIGGELYKRYDVKPRRQVPHNSIPCQEPDQLSGHWPHWVKCDRSKSDDKYFFEAFDRFDGKLTDGTFELCGPKVQGNHEKFNTHRLMPHGICILSLDSLDFNYIHAYLANPKNDIEGIVFHHVSDGRMCKIRKSDFGIKR